MCQNKEQLVKGKIPAHTKCPFTKECIYSNEHIGDGLCKHKGIEHKTPFSCATARAIDLLEKEVKALNKEHNT